MAIINTSALTLMWKCDNSLNHFTPVVPQSIEEHAQVGNPICPVCDTEMEILNYVKIADDAVITPSFGKD